MARTLSTVLSIIEIDSANSVNTTGRQLYYASGEVTAPALDKMGPITIAAAPASPIDLFPSHLNISAGQRITAYFKIVFDPADASVANRLVTWVADAAQVETNVESGGGFSCDTSLTLDRNGTQPCTLEMFYRVD